MRTGIWIAAVLVIGTGAAAKVHGQTAVYGEFTGGKVDSPNTSWMFGPTVGLYHDSGYGLIALGEDVRGSFLRHGDTGAGGNSQALDTIELGVRAAVTPHVLPIKPYVEAMGGYGHLTIGQGSARESASHFAYQFLGGVDFTFFPRLDWRVVEFSFGKLSGVSSSYAPETVSTGLVFRLP